MSVARNNGSQSVHYLRKPISYLDAASTVTIGTVPAGAVVIGAGVIVTTAFNSGSTDILDIGTSGDTDGFATDLDLQTVGNIVWDELATSNDVGPYTADTDLKCVLAATGTAVSAGVAEVYVTYLPDN